MLSFREIEELIEEHLTRLSAEPNISGALRSYRVNGGDETDNPWRVAGLYAYENKDTRLVLEALYLSSRDTCVVRVFREGRPQILYGRKSVGDVTTLASIVDEAAAQFLLQLNESLPLQSIESGYGFISKVLGKSLSQALAPIPPPVDLSQVESSPKYSDE